MSWNTLIVSLDSSHHTTPNGTPAYDNRFDLVLKFHAPGLAPVVLGQKAWHIYPDGAPAYSQTFTKTFGFYEGLAAVALGKDWHHITPDGQDVYPQRYAWCGNFQGGRCTVRTADNLYYHITPNGQSAYRQRWRYAGDYKDGIAVVQSAQGTSTHVDQQGNIVHGQWFLDLDVFHKGYARAKTDDGWTHVDTRGQPVYRRRFATVEPFYNGQARVERFDGALEVIDESGVTICELRSARCSEFAALSQDMVGFWRTHTIATAVKLGVMESLPADEQELAKRCGLPVREAIRLLRGLQELNLVRRVADQWELTLRGSYLCVNNPLTLADAAIEYAGPLQQMWKQLGDALSMNSGWKPPEIFNDVASDKQRCETHHRMLRSYARHDYPVVVPCLKLRRDERVIDAGGGSDRLLDSL